MTEHTNTRSVPTASSLALGNSLLALGNAMMTAQSDSYNMTRTRSAEDTLIDRQAWLVALIKPDDTVVYVRDTRYSGLTEFPHEAMRFADFNATQEELKYWHNKERQLFQTWHRTAQVVQYDPVTDTVVGNAPKNFTCQN